MLSEHAGVPGPDSLKQPRRTLDVREQERDRLAGSLRGGDAYLPATT